MMSRMVQGIAVGATAPETLKLLPLSGLDVRNSPNEFGETRSQEQAVEHPPRLAFSSIASDSIVARPEAVICRKLEGV